MPSKKYNEGSDNQGLIRFKAGTFQEFLGAEIMLALSSVDYAFIERLCRTGLMIHWGEAKDLSPDVGGEISGERASGLKDDYLSLLRVSTSVRLAYQQTLEGKQAWSVPWPPELINDPKKFETWFKPWATIPFEAHKTLMDKEQTKLTSPLIGEIGDFTLRTKFLTEAGKNTLHAIFLSWGIYRASELLLYVTKKVDPYTAREITHVSVGRKNLAP